MYVRLCNGLQDKGILVKEEEIYDHITSDKDFYQSLYYYNQQQYEQFQKTGSVKGVKDVVTNKLLFDVDFEGDLEKARQETVNIFKFLFANEFPENSIQIYFSGGKGFHIVVELDEYFSPKEMKSLVINMQKQSEMHIDLSVYDYAQILRVPGTRHQKTGLYKTPITIDTLANDSIDNIKERAVSLETVGDFSWETAKTEIFPNVWFEMKKEDKIKEILTSVTPPMDWSKKPKHWKNCKWSILQGNFKEKERHQALMVLAATCRGLGYDADLTYYTCKSALKKQSKISGQDEFDKGELWNNIIKESIFKDGWEGGQYSCKTDPWLHKYCESLGDHKCRDRNEEPNTMSFEDMSNKFIDYASNFDQNIIKTGLKELDDHATFLASTLVGVLGQPGAGKTSLLLNYLRNTSLNNIPSLFFSLDMGLPIVFAKLVQKQTGLPFKQVMELYKNDARKREEINEIIKSEYRNVGFNYKSGLTTNDIKNTILDHQEAIGKEVKLVGIDYLECIAGPYSDSVANTGLIANQLKDIANETNTCIALLLQTQKHSTPQVSDPLLSLKNVKGSSVLEQSMSSILTLWREGYSPTTVEDDNYISFAVVKNRFGSLWQGDFSWEGVTGNIRSLSEEEKETLKEFRAWKKQQRDAENKSTKGSGGWD
jgi:replicative DNA helicase